jgi:hypothetical protein
MTPEVAQAVEQIRAGLPQAEVKITEEADGGAVVVIAPIDPGSVYLQRETWIGFRITFQYPYADVYPHFVRPDLSRADGADLGEGMSLQTFEGQPALQISRRSNKLDPSNDTALTKVLKVLTWLRSR